MRRLSGQLPWLGWWCRRHRRWITAWLCVGLAGWLLGLWGGWVPPGLAFGPAALGLLGRLAAPATYERQVAGPLRRAGWRWHVRRRWAAIAEACGLSAREVGRGREGQPRTRLVAPRLQRVRARDHLLALTVRARAGQTVEDLELAAPRLASTLAAVSYRCRPVTGSWSSTVIELVMLDALTTPTTAGEPEPRAVVDQVRLGRAQSDNDWLLPIRGRHTLVAGCSGAGKGSVLWGICGGLSPAVRAGVVQLWGVDLKRGVELSMGEGLFSARAYTPDAALLVLKQLMRVIDERGDAMAGATRLHEPLPGDPLHVLVIDELAALTAYADLSIRREAERLLSEILTQGRALGVVVVACVQDPRKDVVAMRGLFTQTIALRLRSAEETVMVLGEGMSRIAPAHRISPTHPGTAWIVDDTGAADRVRADFWPDGLIRELAARYATCEYVDVTPQEAEEPNSSDTGRSHKRSPRKQRQPVGSGSRGDGAA